jgi:hypothetical protein
VKGALLSSDRVIPTLRRKLHDVVSCESQKWEKRTVKARKNALVSMCGLEPMYTPNWVRESIRELPDGTMQSVCTGRDGRILWKGTSKLSRRPTIDGKFTSFRFSLGKRVRKRLDRMSYLFSVLAENKPTAKSVRPLIRLSLQWYSLQNKSFDGLLRKIKSSLGRNCQVRRPSSISSISKTKPRLIRGAEKKSNLIGLASIPIWDYFPRE